MNRNPQFASLFSETALWRWESTELIKVLLEFGLIRVARIKKYRYLILSGKGLQDRFQA